MKLDILTFCLLCFHFQPSFVHGSCSSCKDPCDENHNISIPEAVDGLPRRDVTFHCPLTENALGFYTKLFKGRDKKELCIFYAENRTENASTKSCNPVFSANSVSFELKNISEEISTYTCCLETLVPLYTCCITNETYLYLYIQSTQGQDSEKCFLSEFTSWTLVVLTAFSIVGSICCFLLCCHRSTVCQHSASTCDYNNEYMSMAAVIPNEKSRREHLRRPIAV